MYNNSISMHQQKITSLESQIKNLLENFEKTKNLFLSPEINQKIIKHEISQLEEEVRIHNYCIECIVNNEVNELILDSDLTSAKKKKILKLMGNKITAN